MNFDPGSHDPQRKVYDMNNAILAAKTASIPYKSDQFEISQLGKATFKEVVRILEDVRASLPEDERHFIKPQSLADLYNHHSRGFPVLGSVEMATGKIAGVLLITPSEGSDANPKLANYPQSVKECDTGIISSVATTPGYSGQMEPLLDQALQYAATGLMAVWAKVSDENTRSSKRFTESGFVDKIHGYDPERNYAVTYYRKSLDGIAPKELPVFNEGHEPSRILQFPTPERN